MKRLARRAIAWAGYDIARAGQRHRFDAMDDALATLRGAGYAPRVIVDAGANVGAWTRLARRHFPDAAVHLIEPQPACAPALARVARAGDRVHQVAVTVPGRNRVAMIGSGPGGVGTGARVAAGTNAADAFDVPAVTLDEILPGVAAADRALLKLDLEGYEMEALRGAPRLLQAVEVILTEVQFFEIDRNGLPTCAEVIARLGMAGFDLYDVAALAARRRDGRLNMGDLVFVARRSPLAADLSWR